jgi:nucleotide-binding universal stress UspA family protein
MIRKMLVPVDGSERALKAVELASDLADKYGASLVLLYVTTTRELLDSVRHFREVEHIPEPPAWVYESAVADHILQKAQECAKGKGLTAVQAAVRDGDPAKAIVDFAKEEKFDAIVMGTRSISDLRGLFMGSIAHKVSHLAECTVVAVK